MAPTTDLAVLDDAELARRIAAGNAPAEEAELCRRLGRRARLYGLRHLRDPHAAADLAQQVMLTTIERLRAGALRDPAMLASFVLGTCRMVALDLRRTHARRTRLLGTYADDEPEVAPDDGARLDHARVADCLRALPVRERSILIMTFYAERPAAELATETGLTETNVRVIRHRALARMRDCVEGGGARKGPARAGEADA
jgi:RNA polymerase sigma-70 factor (ECF subfamily)